MQYRRVPKNGDQLSALGFGAMRLPTKRGRIDEDRAIRLIRTAIDEGVNYIDTAFPYHGGESERVVGRALMNGYRDRVYLATKLPPWSVKTRGDMDRILSIQLERLCTDHIDYYLLHSLSGPNWRKMLDLGVIDFFTAQIKAGRIRNIGFSFHGDRKSFFEIIDAYDWTFCLIQYNFLDEENQAGKEGLLYAASKDIAVMVMEPLRGGMLAGKKVPKEVQKIYAEKGPDRTAAAWGLSWVLNHYLVTVVLSGMNDENHLAENVKTADSAIPGAMTGGELAMIDEVRAVYSRFMKVDCTGCSYCMPCPFGVNIPQCFFYYNQYHMQKNRLITRGLYGMQLLGVMGNPGNASLCKNCKKCLPACPQGIFIPEKLGDVSKTLEGWPTRFILFFAKKMFPTGISDE